MTTIRRLVADSDPAAGSERTPLSARAERELAALVGDHPVAAARPAAAATGRTRAGLVTAAVSAVVIALSVGALQLAGPAAVVGGTATAVPNAVLQLVPTVWRVRDAAGEGSDTWLRFGVNEIDVLRPNGSIFFGSATQGDQLITLQMGYSMSLGRAPSAPWLDATTRFERDGDGWTLYDAAGRVTARLRADGTPPKSTDHQTQPEPVTAFVRQQLQDAVPGAGVRPIATDALVGRWLVPGVSVADASVTFTAAGGWRSAARCPGPIGSVGGSGRYRLLPSGVVLMTAYASAAVACLDERSTPAPAARAFTALDLTRSVRIDGDELTLFDRDGQEIGRLQRAP